VPPGVWKSRVPWRGGASTGATAAGERTGLGVKADAGPAGFHRIAEASSVCAPPTTHADGAAVSAPAVQLRARSGA